MGRECRRVPPGWDHPKDEAGRYVPLFDDSFADAARRYAAESEQWTQGFRDDYRGGFKPIEPEHAGMSFEEWSGSAPRAENYRPEWRAETATHYQMYETCSEGTPLSPVFSTPEEVARYCADNAVSSCGAMTAPYEAWLAVANGAFAPSAIFTPENGLISGVEAITRLEPKP